MHLHLIVNCILFCMLNYNHPFMVRRKRANCGALSLIDKLSARHIKLKRNHLESEHKPVSCKGKFCNSKIMQTKTFVFIRKYKIFRVKYLEQSNN